MPARGHENIRAVDIKPVEEWYQQSEEVENLSLDLNLKEDCEIAARGAFEIYNLAANMATDAALPRYRCTFFFGRGLAAWPCSLLLVSMRARKSLALNG